MADAEQYFASSPAAASSPGVVRLDLGDVRLELATDAGVFSRTRLDPGTSVLLHKAPAPTVDGDYLDLGCGYGPIALTLAARRPQARVWAVDVNERAVELVRRNAAAAGLTNVTACLPDEVPADLRFTAVWSNPPIRIGKPALHELLLTWLPRLTVDGEALLVVQRNLGADSLASWLADQGYTVDRVASQKGFRVLQVRPDCL